MSQMKKNDYYCHRELEIKKQVLDIKIENYEMKQYLAELKGKYSDDEEVRNLQK